MKNDAELQRDVMEELRLEPRVDASHVGVTAREGEVTLTGRVQTH